MSAKPTIYTARWVLPITSPPVADGAVAVEGSRIVAVGRSSDLASQYPDSNTQTYGEAVILPGLVNTHSHLELTVMRGFLEAEERDFFAWLKKLTVSRMAMSSADLTVSAASGAVEAARAGITCFADSSSAALETLEALRAVGLRAIVYQESFGPDPKTAIENTEKLTEQVGRMRSFESELLRAGISPHAPYTVSPPQLELLSRLAIDHKLPLMMHAAESEAEKRLLWDGSGPFAEGLKRRGIEWRPPGMSTISYLKQHGLFETRPLLAHCINVDEADLAIIRKHNAGVAHCPTSNAKLGHGRAPFAEFISKKIKVGLGSDSVVSNNVCDLISEARFATLMSRLPSSQGANSEFTVSAERALFSATMGGAQALGIDHLVGALAAGMQADLTVVDLKNPHQQPSSNPIDELIFSSSGRDVLLTVVAGREIFREGVIQTVDQSELFTRLNKVRSRLNMLS